VVLVVHDFTTSLSPLAVERADRDNHAVFGGQQRKGTELMFNDIDQRTPFDLNFSLFGIPIRVHPFFWIVAALLGNWVMGDPDLGFPYLLLWIACVFVSVLLHELGHALTGRLFGNRAHILLYSFGGLAIGSIDAHNRRWQRILVLFAGPGIQLVLFGIIWGIFWWMGPEVLTLSLPIRATLVMLWIINLVWSLFNLLPIWPLDGGQITREIAVGARPRDGIIISLVISALVSGVLFVHMILAQQHRPLPFLEWLPGSYFNAFFMLMFCVMSLQALQFENARRRQQHFDDDRFPWE
jgi:stage IV sporulation protein FB